MLTEARIGLPLLPPMTWVSNLIVQLHSWSVVKYKSQIQANTSHKRRWSNTSPKHKSQTQVKHKWPNTILKLKANTSHEHKTNQCTAVGNLSSALSPAAPATCNDRGRIISVAIGKALVANLPNCLQGQSGISYPYN